MNKYITITLILFLVISCKNVKSIFDNQSDLSVESNNLRISNGKSMIFFTSGFYNNEVKVIANDKVVYIKNLTTVEQIGLAGSCIVKNTDIIMVKINKDKIVLKSKKISQYKFIYIQHYKNRYTVNYTNVSKSFR
ncbi:hypothetical protein [Chryseobacterium sp. MMS23-Vi53]|uniref:hypothetical protein n=1 Tax=Chryseobacterium sp. MMS23-Vi53 TaxID=3386644 RepID=UPI0039EAEEF0